MNNPNALRAQFEELKERSLEPDARIYGTFHSGGLWKSWHALAEARYEPAKEFLVERLEDPRWDWRRVSISLLGFHYKLEHHVLEKIRNLLRHDTDSGVRISAASVLGSQGQFPEKTLIHAVGHDPDDLVRASAFSALLALAHVPYRVRMKESKSVRAKQIQPSLDEVKRVFREQDMSASISLLNEAKSQ